LSVLRAIEQKIEGLFEGVFGRAFRTHVQPVELARKLVKEMDDHKTVSVSRIYVPNEYTVYLCSEDRAQFAEYEGQLRSELAEYLTEHARRESYMLLTPPVELLETDDDLAIGEFGIATRMVQADGRRSPRADEPRPEVEPGATMIYKPKAPPQETEAISPEDLGMERELVWLAIDGTKHEVTKRRMVIGRSKECDIQLSDPNVSRQHAELRQEGAGFWIVDLDSTNGIEVNGERTKRAKLERGDRIVLGSTELTFDREVPR
jgi:hypothetical protein